MRIAGVAFLCLVGGCGGAVSTSDALAPLACALDGSSVDSCYAASKGGGAVFGIAMTRGAEMTNAFVAFFFDASTIAHGASAFPAANSHMGYIVGPSTATCDGVGSATWTNDGAAFCVTTDAKCESTSPTVHVSCVPSAMLN